MSIGHWNDCLSTRSAGDDQKQPRKPCQRHYRHSTLRPLTSLNQILADNGTYSNNQHKTTKRQHQKIHLNRPHLQDRPKNQANSPGRSTDPQDDASETTSQRSRRRRREVCEACQSEVFVLLVLILDGIGYRFNG